MKIISACSSLLFLLIVQTICAEVRLPAIIGNHMVLQQRSETKIWGWCDPNEKITVKTSWDTTNFKTTGGSNAKFSLAIRTPAAGGPFTITISGNNNITLDDVLVGEVWLCSGQSNMSMNFNALNYPEEVAAATNTQIRLFQIPRSTADFPQDDTRAQWVVCNPEDMKRFSAVGYFFGSKIQQQLSQPVGLINASWGGTPAETWTPQELVKNDTALRAAAMQLKPAAGWPVIPGAAFNAMINPITNYQIAGALWYQGEANVNTWSTYQSLLTTMIGSWRARYGKVFPFYLVQIAPYAGYGADNYRSALLREAETKVLTYPKTGMVVISDLVNDIKNIHPTMKKEVGTRLADYALAETYGKTGLAYRSPEFKTMKVEKNKARLSFDYAPNGLVTKNGAPINFYIAGADQVFKPATARVDGSSVVVFNKEVPQPVAVRFGFTNDAMPNLYSKDGLPVNAFRTDDWPVQSTTTR